MGCPIAVRVDSKTVCFLLSPVTLVIVAICMDQTSIAIDGVLNEVALIHTAIRPDYEAGTMTLLTKPMPLVALARGELDTWAHLCMSKR